MSYLRTKTGEAEPLLAVPIGVVTLTNIADADNLINFTFPSGKRERYALESVQATAIVVASTAGKTTTLTAKRTRGGSTVSTGVVLVLTTANQDTEGEAALSTATAGAAEKEFISGDVFTLVASATTQFSQGTSEIVAYFRRKPY